MANIKNEYQYKATMERVEELLPMVNDSTPKTDKNLIELELLSNLLADYDEEHFPIESPTLAKIIKLRMYELNLTQAKLSVLIGVSPSRVSEYLTGKSEPTLKVARTISKELDINPAIVLGVWSRSWYVDMGDTSCKVPLIKPYIEKVEARGTIGKKRKRAMC